MLYHSNSLDDARKFINNESVQHMEDNLKLIGSQVNDVIAWM
jgi:hypothetical protein